MTCTMRRPFGVKGLAPRGPAATPPISRANPAAWADWPGGIARNSPGCLKRHLLLEEHLYMRPWSSEDRHALLTFGVTPARLSSRIAAYRSALTLGST